MIAQDVIRRALRMAGVIASGETPNADDISDALDTFNALLAEWHVAGIGIPDYSVASEATTMGADLADREGMAYQLALRIAGEYGQELSPTQVQEGEAAWSRVRLRYFQPGTSPVADLPNTASTFNITTG